MVNMVNGASTVTALPPLLRGFSGPPQPPALHEDPGKYLAEFDFCGSH
jgi:hypothetical protein